MRVKLCLCLALLAGMPQTVAAQAPTQYQLVTVLHPAPLPPGGLVPYRQGKLWGYADTSRQVVVTPRWESTPRLNVGGKFSLTRHCPGQSSASQVDWPQMAVNARGETLLVPPGQALRLLPDSSLTLAAPGQPDVTYVKLQLSSSTVTLVPSATALPTGELAYRPRYQFESDGRFGPLGYGLQMREKDLWQHLYLNKHFELKWHQPAGPNALADARNRRLTGYHYGQMFPFHNGLALVNRGGRHGYIDRRGREVIVPQFGFGTADFRWHRAIVSDAKSPWESGNQGLIDTLGRFVIPLVAGQRLLNPSPPLSDSTRPPLLVRQLQTPAGLRAVFLNYDGQRVFPDRVFTDALPFEHGRAWVQCQQKVGLLDEQGHFVLNCEYDDLLFEQVNDLNYGSHQEHRTELSRSMRGLLNGSSAITPDSVCLRAQLNGRYGYVRRSTGRVLIPFRYDSVQWSLRGGLAFLKRAGQVYMVDLRGQELAAGARRNELLRDGQRFFQLARPGQWCLVDTAGHLRLPWQPNSLELIDFQPASNLAIVQQARSANGDAWRYSLLSPTGLLSTWNHSLLLFWGPTEVLGELAQTSGPRYVVYDHRGRVRRQLAYLSQWRFPGAGLAVLYRPDDAAAGTLVLDLVAGGVRHRLPSAWVGVKPAAPQGFRPATGPHLISYEEAGAELHRWHEKPAAAWPGLWVNLNAHTRDEQVLGYLDRYGRRFWED